MILISVLTQIVVLVKTAAVAGAFGVNTDIDAYNAVHSVANFLFSFLGTGITTVLIPAYLQKKEKKAIDTFMTFLYIMGICLVIVALLFQSVILNAFSASRRDFVKIGSSVFLITMLSQFFNTQLGVSNAYFQVKDKFNIPKICTLFTNLLLLALIIIDKDITIRSYAFYTALTTVMNAVIQIIIAVLNEYRYSITFNFSNNEYKEMMKVFLPTVFSAGLYQVNLLTDSFVASRVGEGQISILTYSNQVITLVNALLVTNIMTFMYPKIAKSINDNRGDDQTRLLDFIYFGEALMGLLLVGFFAIGKEAVMMLFEHGKFNAGNTNLVYKCICLYMVGFPINIFRDLIYRYFYARGNTKETFKNSVIVSAANFVISITLAYYIGLYGVIIGTIVSSFLSAIMIKNRMDKNYGQNYDLSRFRKEQLKIVISTVLSCVVLFTAKQVVHFNYIATFFVFGILAIVIYAFFIYITKSKSIMIRFE